MSSFNQQPQVRQTSTASTTIADNVPIPTNSSSHATNIPITSQDVDELNSNAMVDGNTFANSSTSAAALSSSQNDHPLEQVIGEPSRPVLTRNQLRSDGDMCMYALMVSTIEPKNVKEAMTDPAWIASMQEEHLQFKRMDPQFSLHYESEPGYNENYTSYPYDSSSRPQQYLCCARCGGPRETYQCDQLIFDEPYCKHCGKPHINYQCQPMNQDSYNSNSLGFDQPQPPQSPVIHQPPQELSIQEMEDLKQQYLDELQRLSNLEYRDEIKIAELKENFNGMSIEIRKKEKLLQEEQWAYLSTHPSKHLHSFCFDDDDEDSFSAITPDEPVLSTEEPDNSLNQFEDLSESNEEFSSTDDDSFSIDNIDYVEASPPDSELVSSKVMEIVIPEVGGIEESNDNPIPFYDPIIPGTPLNLTPSGESDFFLESCFDEDVLEKIILKPLSEEEIILMKSLRTHDSFLSILSKIDSLLDEFAGELTLFKSIPPGIDEADCDFEEDIRLIEKLFDSLMEEIDLFCTPDYPMLPGIMDKDYDSKRDILIPKDLPSNNSLSFAEKESFHFDIHPFSRPPAKPPDDDT
nr:Gag-Pol polyprotein [Tanacetum cinerariifolium]